MSNLYKILSIGFFIFSVFIAGFLYIQKSNAQNYWGNDSYSGTLWLSPENKNVSAFRMGNSADVEVLGVKKESENRYKLAIVMGGKNFDAFLNANTTAIYKIDSKGVPIPVNINDLLIQQRDKVRIDYFRKLSDSNIYIETLYYEVDL